MYFKCSTINFFLNVLLYSGTCLSFITTNSKLTINLNQALLAIFLGKFDDFAVEAIHQQFSICNLEWKQIDSVVPDELINYRLNDDSKYYYFVVVTNWSTNGLIECTRERNCFTRGEDCYIHYINHYVNCSDVFGDGSTHYLLTNPQNCYVEWIDSKQLYDIAQKYENEVREIFRNARNAVNLSRVLDDLYESFLLRYRFINTIPCFSNLPIWFAPESLKNEHWRFMYIKNIKYFQIEGVKVEKSQSGPQNRTEISHEELHNSLNQPWSFTVVGQEARDTTFHVEVPEEYSIDIHSRKNIPKLEELTDAEFEFLFDLLPTHGKQEKTISLPKSLSQTYLVDRHSCATVVINERKTSERETLKVELRMLPNPIWNESEREAAFRYINGPKMDRENLSVAVTLNRSTLSFGKVNEFPLQMFSHTVSLLERASVFSITASLATLLHIHLMQA